MQLKRLFGTGILILFVGLTIMFLPDNLVSAGSTNEIARRSEEEQRIIDVYKGAGNAVVFITTLTLTVDPFEIIPEIQPREGSGSGVVVDANKGIILTNLHVIQDAHKIEIALSNGQTYKARLVGYDDEYDIAVLQIATPPEQMVSVPFGDSSKLEVGQRVVAIGNPFGLDRTLTTGNISSLDRTVRTQKGHLMRGLVQIDAAINPGNSGGPLLDTDGRLIGINTAILSHSGDSAGIGFAVPINQIKRVLPELIATGRVLRPKLGWVLVDTNQGPMVRRVIKGSPSDLAGIQSIERPVDNVFIKGYVRDFDSADLIYAVNGKRTLSLEDVEEAIAQAPSGNKIMLTLRRGGLNGRERVVEIKPLLG